MNKKSLAFPTTSALPFDIGDIKVAVFDLDGTIYIGGTLLAGVPEMLEFLKASGKEIFFVTNASVSTRQRIKERLAGFGIDTDLEHIISSGYLTALYLKERGVKRVFALTSDSLKEEFTLQGLEVVEDKPEAVAIAYYPDFVLDDLEPLIKAYRAGMPIIAANTDKTFPRKIGVVAPAAAAIMGATLATFGLKQVTAIAGKPSPFALEIVTERTGVKATQILMFGDSFESDVQMALNYGSPAVWLTEAGKSAKGYAAFSSMSKVLESIKGTKK